MDFIHEQLKPGYKFMVSLCSAKGKEEFYKKFGFAELYFRQNYYQETEDDALIFQLILGTQL